MVHAAPDRPGWLSRLLTTDFCPWANRAVYWLKEPVGWFALATVICVVIGQHVSPVGWPLAAALASIMSVGMVWPAVAVRVVGCGLRPETEAVHEDMPCRMVLSVRNRLPAPVWGLAVEGYLDSIDTDRQTPTVALACVPPLCTADYHVEVMPRMRGHYPVASPQIACSFPFGIWTARRTLQRVEPVTVWPAVHAMPRTLTQAGEIDAEIGDGSRPGRGGDFVGVRSYRRGDSAKQVNGVASARCESLVVTERGEPQSVRWEVVLDTRSNGDDGALARRVRVAASVLASLHQYRIAARVWLGDDCIPFDFQRVTRRRMLDKLADVPISGCDCRDVGGNAGGARLTITGGGSGEVLVRMDCPRSGRRSGQRRQWLIGPNEDLAASLASMTGEVRDVSLAA